MSDTMDLGNIDVVADRVDAPSGLGDNGGGTSNVSIGDNGGTATVTNNNGVLSVIDPVTGVAVTIATVNPPMTLPPIHITVYSPVNPTDPQWAKQEASLIGSLTTAALAKIGVPALFAAVVGSQVGTELSSPDGVTALQNINSDVVNAMALIGETAVAQPYGIFIAGGLP